MSEPDQDFLLQNVRHTLPDQERLHLERDLELQELTTSLGQSNKEKTAGYDGLPYEF